jgi:hypothetical protein
MLAALVAAHEPAVVCTLTEGIGILLRNKSEPEARTGSNKMSSIENKDYQRD